MPSEGTKEPHCLFFFGEGRVDGVDALPQRFRALSIPTHQSSRLVLVQRG